MHSPSPAADRDVFAVTLDGDVDIVRRTELHELVTSFRESTAAHVEVDLGAVEFMDSTGLGALVGLRLIAEERGGVVRLLHPRRLVRRALDVAGLSGLCEIVD